jgi:glyoxylase I family protein
VNKGWALCAQKNSPSAIVSAGILVIQAEAAMNDHEAGFRVWGIRYQVTDIDGAVVFYTKHLGFKLEHQQGQAFAKVSMGGLSVLLSGPGSSGSRTLPDGRKQVPGGWNRLVLKVDDLPAIIATLEKAGLHFRNQMETGPGGRQIQLEDPDGNPIELFQAAS